MRRAQGAPKSQSWREMAEVQDLNLRPLVPNEVRLAKMIEISEVSCLFVALNLGLFMVYQGG